MPWVENMTNDDIEDSLLVNAVLSDMMDKQCVKHVDLGMKPLVKKVKDPTHRMNYRHQKVPMVLFIYLFFYLFNLSSLHSLIKRERRFLFGWKQYGQGWRLINPLSNNDFLL